MKRDWRYMPLKWLLTGLSYLPLGVLYVIADFLYVIVYHVVRYRRKVALKNIRESFPDMSEADHRRVLREFYRNFADYVVETIKLNHITDAEICRRMEFEGVDIIDDFFDQGRSVVAYFSHCGNWEWAPSFTLHSRYSHDPRVAFCQVYRPLRNEWFDAYFLHLRSRFDPLSFPKRSVLRDLLRLRRDNTLSVTGFMSDQKPSHGDPTHVVEFLHHPTAMITGTETLARKLGMGVVYWDMYKLGRGHYKIKVRHMSDDASAEAPHALTEKYASMLQNTIRRNPSIWLWTHKRWKNPVSFPDQSVTPEQR